VNVIEQVPDREARVAEATARPHQTPVKRVHERRASTWVRKALLALLGPAILVAVWQFVVSAEIVDRLFLSAPKDVAVQMWEMILDGSLWEHLAASLIRVIGGFLLACAIGIGLGLLMGRLTVIRVLVAPVLELLRPISPVAWIPLAMLWFGLGNGTAWFVIFLAAFFPIVTSTYKGVTSVSVNDLRAAACCGINGFALARKVILPSALPDIMAGLRIGLGIGFMAVIAAELVAAQSGLGYLIERSRQMFDTQTVLVGMVTVGIVGLVINTLMAAIERSLTAWRQAGSTHQGGDR